MSCHTRPFLPPFRLVRQRGGTAYGQLSLAFAWGRSPRPCRSAQRPITPYEGPRRSPIRRPLFPLLSKRGRTGRTVLETGGKAGANAFPPGSTVRGNGEGTPPVLDLFGLPPSAVCCVWPRARPREIAGPPGGPRPLSGPARLPARHVSCACPAASAARGIRGVAASRFRRAPLRQITLKLLTSS